MSRAAPLYASKAISRRALETAREFGLEIGGFEMGADGTVRVLTAKAAASHPSAFDRFEGQL